MSRIGYKCRRFVYDVSRAMREMDPLDEANLSRPVKAIRNVQSAIVLSLFELNDYLLGRFCTNRPYVYDPSRWSWVADAEAAVPEMRAEIEAYLAGGPLLDVAAATGLDLATEGGQATLPLAAGSWDTVAFFMGGRFIEPMAAHFPVASRVVSSIHPKEHVGFSGLGPRSHIRAHHDANRGALRVQIPLIVPGNPGDVRLRVDDEMITWEVGKTIVFDLFSEHEAWNDTDGYRVALMFEIPMPLPFPLSLINRVVQASFRWHPSDRLMPKRMAEAAARHDQRVLAEANAPG